MAKDRKTQKDRLGLIYQMNKSINAGKQDFLLDPGFWLLDSHQ